MHEIKVSKEALYITLALQIGAMGKGAATGTSSN